MDGFSKSIEVKLDTSRFTSELSNVASIVERELTEPVMRSTEFMADSLGSVIGNVESALEKLGQTGRISISQMVDAILSDFRRLAFEQFVSKPVTGFLEQIAQGFVQQIAGARANGGPVSAAHAYLVGERGPEIFVPSGAGRIDTLGGTGDARAVNIHFNISTPNAESFRRSESQIAAMLNRTVRRGSRST